MKKSFPIHVRTVTGLESVLAGELTVLGAQDIQAKGRLVICNGDLSLLYRANLWCRTAIRVLRPVATFPARDEKALYAGVKAIDWSHWLSATGTLCVGANVSSSFTSHSLFLAQLVKDAVVDQFRQKTGKRPSVDLEKYDLRIVLSLFQDNAQIYVDSSGESLHKRGYRLRAGEAPLSETLAAGILKLSGWDGTTPLLDPMCGSGTFGIEAGLMLKNIAPGLLRKRFGFQGWPDYDRSLFERLLIEAKQAIRQNVSTPIVGIDIDPKVVEIARQNVDRAGLTGLVRIERGDFFEWQGAKGNAGTIVMNPPYDERLSVANVADLYQRIGDRLKQGYAGWTAHVLSGNLEAIKSFGLRSSQRGLMYNGSLECRLLKFELRAGGSDSARPHWRKDATPTGVFVENPKWIEKASLFSNRLRKNAKHLAKQARRDGRKSYRVYDWDIPELAFRVDWDGSELHFLEIRRNHDRSPLEHQRYMDLMVRTAAEVMNIAAEKVQFKRDQPPIFLRT